MCIKVVKDVTGRRYIKIRICMLCTALDVRSSPANGSDNGIQTLPTRKVLIRPWEPGSTYRVKFKRESPCASRLALNRDISG